MKSAAKLSKAEIPDLDDIEDRSEQSSRPGKTKREPKLSQAEMWDLIESNWEVGKRLAWSFLSSWRIRMNSDEVTSIVAASLCEAGTRFDPSKNVSFKTFFFYYLRGMLLKEISRMVQEKRLGEALVDAAGSDMRGVFGKTGSRWPFGSVDQDNPERLLERRQIAVSCWKACSELDPLEREIVYRHFVNDESLKDIAAELGYCRCHISRVKSAALTKLERILVALNDRAPNLPRIRRVRTVREEEKGYTGGRGRSRSKKISTADASLLELRRRA